MAFLTAILAFFGSVIPAGIKAWLTSRKAPEIEEAEKAGAATQAAADAAAALKTQQAVTEAEANAAMTQAALVEQMSKGEF